MKVSDTVPNVEYHPVRGYATEQQFKKLMELGVCPERESIWKKIKQQERKAKKK